MWDVRRTQENACKSQAGKPMENTWSNPFIKWAFYIPGRRFTRKYDFWSKEQGLSSLYINHG